MTGLSCIPGATIAQGARASGLCPCKDSKQTTRDMNIQANTQQCKINNAGMPIYKYRIKNNKSKVP